MGALAVMIANLCQRGLAARVHNSSLSSHGFRSICRRTCFAVGESCCMLIVWAKLPVWLLTPMFHVLVLIRVAVPVVWGISVVDRTLLIVSFLLFLFLVDTLRSVAFAAWVITVYVT